MCYSDHSGNNHNSSGSDNTGFHLACGNGQAKEPEASTMPEAKETPAPEVFAVIGQEAEGENVFAVKLTNRTGADIVAVSV
jgi:hypothetical protein